MLEWLLAYYFLSSALPVDRWPQRGPGGGGCPFSENVLGRSSKISGMKSGNTLHFRVANYGYFISIFFGSRVSLKSKTPSFQCETTDKTEHIGPLEKVNSLLHNSKYLT